MSVVIVNTLLTSIMAKLAKFERHVSLSDYTSTVTAKLAVAQFLNTALIVIIVNAGYTGGGLGFVQVGMGTIGASVLVPFCLFLLCLRTCVRACVWSSVSFRRGEGDSRGGSCRMALP